MSWSQKNMTATPAFAPGVHINDPVIKAFSISGSNFSELNEAVLRVGPFDAETNRRWWGMTRWNISWKFSHATDSNQCRLDQFALTLDGVIDLPDFANRHAASEEMKAKWDSFIKALRAHEYGHWSTGIDAINDLEKRLLQIPPKEHCDALNREIEAIGAQVIQEYREVDRRYDRVTNHGVKFGATF